jgi:hypothetical protein
MTGLDIPRLCDCNTTYCPEYLAVSSFPGLPLILLSIHRSLVLLPKVSSKKSPISSLKSIEPHYLGDRELLRIKHYLHESLR